jgi:hypothetical protein
LEFRATPLAAGRGQKELTHIAHGDSILVLDASGSKDVAPKPLMAAAGWKFCMEERISVAMSSQGGTALAKALASLPEDPPLRKAHLAKVRTMTRSV